MNIIQILYMDNIFTQVNNLYNKKGFFARYGLDVWTTVIIFIIFFIATTYFYVLNHLQPIRANWANERCNPAVIPFAGIINGKSGKESLEFTGENFTGCIQTILQNITGYAFAPVYYLMKTFTETLHELTGAVNSARGMFNNVRNSVKDFGKDTMSRTLNITAPLVELTINARDILGKTIGTLTATLFTLFGSYLGLQSLIGAIMQFILIILLAMVAIILVSWILSFFFPPASIIALSTTAAMVALLIPYIIVQITVGEVMNLPFPSPPGIPSKPSCFAENTIIKLKNKEKKIFANLEIGDQLVDGSIVTAIMKLSSANEDMYKLNDILVTGSHRVYESMDWITVANHPKSIYIDDFREPYVYCINTDTKTIKIGKYTFLDWDEMDEMNLTDLRMNCGLSETLPKDFKNCDIHPNLDVGIHEDMTIELEDGRSININKIEVNDILRFGEQVYGIVKVDVNQLPGVYEYYLKNGTKIKTSKNILIKDSDLGIINTSDIEGIPIQKPKYLYHLLTNMGSFIMNGVRIGDYNTGIEMHLNNEGNNTSDFFI